MPKSFTLDGKRYKLSPLIPTGGIEWYIGRFHVSTSDDEIVSAIDKRTVAWAAPYRAQARKFALYCHRANQALYSRVMRGNL